MYTVSTTRLQRLEMLIEKHGSLAALNDAIGAGRINPTLSQIRTQSPHALTGKPRRMGDAKARQIEERLGLPAGWMDTPPDFAELHPNTSIAHVIRLMMDMQPAQLAQVVQAVTALAKSG